MSLRWLTVLQPDLIVSILIRISIVQSDSIVCLIKVEHCPRMFSDKPLYG